jgi:hypothetical protein
MEIPLPEMSMEMAQQEVFDLWQKAKLNALHGLLLLAMQQDRYDPEVFKQAVKHFEQDVTSLEGAVITAMEIVNKES